MSIQPLTVLVLGHEPEDIELVEALIRAAPGLEAEVLPARAMEEAVAVLEERAVDVAVMDHRPGLPWGLDLLEHPVVRRSRTPVVVITDEDGAETHQAALDAGAVDCLSRAELDERHLARAIRYAAERRRRQLSESRQEALVGASRELVSIVAEDGSLCYVSPSLKRILGFDPQEKEDGDALLEVHPEDRAEVEEALARVFRPDVGRVELRYRVRHADGSWRWLDTVAESHLDDPYIGGVVVSSWDVTDQVRAQRSIRFQAELLDAVGEAVIATDLEGRVIYWNPEAERLYGWSADEAVGRPIMELTVPPDDDARAKRIMAALTRGESWYGEFEVRRKDGSTFTALISNSPIIDAEGRLAGIIGASTDITPIKETQSALKERVKELRTLHRASTILNRTDLEMGERLQELVEILPDGWLRPEDTEARLTVPGRVIQTAGFQETPWMQSVDVSTEDHDGGRLEIALTGGVGPGDADPFLAEEYDLLDNLGGMIRQALERSSLTTLLTGAFASLREAVFVVGEGRTIRYANPVAEDMFGYTVDELVGEPTERLHVDAQAFHRFATESESVLERDGVFHADYDMRKRDGTVFAAEQTVTLLDPERGLAGGVVSVVRDVSEPKAARQKLRESEKRFREIAEVIDDVFWVTTPDKGGCDYLSPAYEEIWGRPTDEVYEDPSTWLDAVVPADRDRVRRFLQEQPEGPRQEEYRIRRPDGEERYILDRSFPVRDAVGTVERIIGVARDVTEERRMEERIGILAREISDVIYVVAPDGSVLMSSPSILEATGYSQEEFEGMNALDVVHPDDREEVGEKLQAVVERPDHVARAEYRVVIKTGETLQVETVARNLMGNPAVGGILLTTRDVSERYDLERRFRQMQKMESVGRLAGGVAHDFNNILTVIRSQADLILMEKPDASVAEDVAVIQDAADRAARLTKQLLAFSREQVMQPRNVDLGDVVRSTSDLIQRLIGEQIRVRCRVAGDLAAVRVDPNQIEQVLVNLAVNARDAIGGDGELVISVEEENVGPEKADPIPDLDPGHYVVLRVSDTGVGIPTEVRDRIFEPFFTTKAKGEGTGLGLSTVYGIVRQSRGSIQVESTPGEGTTFHLFFPAIEGHGGATAGRTPGGQEPTRELHGDVLVVEDDPQVRAAATRVLQNAGFGVSAVGTVEEALRQLAEGPAPDVILTDLMLDGTRGTALMERVADSWNEIPLVVMSGYAHDSPGREGIPADVPFVQKPFTPSGLVRKIHEALDRASDDG